MLPRQLQAHTRHVDMLETRHQYVSPSGMQIHLVGYKLYLYEVGICLRHFM